MISAKWLTGVDKGFDLLEDGCSCGGAAPLRPSFVGIGDGLFEIGDFVRD